MALAGLVFVLVRLCNQELVPRQVGVAEVKFDLLLGESFNIGHGEAVFETFSAGDQTARQNERNQRSIKVPQTCDIWRVRRDVYIDR